MNYSFAEEHAKNQKWKRANRKRAARASKEAMDEHRGKPLPKETEQLRITGGVITKPRKTNPLLK